MTEVTDNTFLEFIQFVFGDWWNWVRFTITALLLKETFLKSAISGTVAFWNTITSLFKRG